MMRMVWMFFLWIAVVQRGVCYEYNEFLLRSEVAIFPKLLQLDERLGAKKSVKVAVIYEAEDIYIAAAVRDEMEKILKGLFGEGVNVESVEVEDFLQHPRNYDALFILKLDSEHKKELVKTLNSKGVVTFTYDANDLKEGFLFSMDIQSEPIIYMNAKKMQKGLFFVPQLYQLVRFYHGS